MGDQRLRAGAPGNLDRLKAPANASQIKIGVLNESALGQAASKFKFDAQSGHVGLEPTPAGIRDFRTTYYRGLIHETYQKKASLDQYWSRHIKCTRRCDRM